MGMKITLITLQVIVILGVGLIGIGNLVDSVSGCLVAAASALCSMLMGVCCLVWELRHSSGHFRCRALQIAFAAVALGVLWDYASQFSIVDSTAPALLFAAPVVLLLPLILYLDRQHYPDCQPGRQKGFFLLLGILLLLSIVVHAAVLPGEETRYYQEFTSRCVIGLFVSPFEPMQLRPLSSILFLMAWAAGLIWHLVPASATATKEADEDA